MKPLAYLLIIGGFETLGQWLYWKDLTGDQPPLWAVLGSAAVGGAGLLLHALAVRYQVNAEWMEAKRKEAKQ